MAIIRYLLTAPLSILFKIFCWITAPIWALIAAIGNYDTLPGILALVHTHDDNVYGTKTTKKPKPERFFDRFKTATWWIFRNPGYGFAAWLLGFKGEDVTVIWHCDPKTTPVTAGWSWELIVDGKSYFGYRRDFNFMGNRVIKTWVGWHYKNQGGYHMLKIDFNPFKTIGG